MSRPKKNKVSYEEKIAMIEEKIEKLSSDLKTAKAEKKELEVKKEESEKSALFEAISNSGKTPEEIIALLKK